MPGRAVPNAGASVLFDARASGGPVLVVPLEDAAQVTFAAAATVTACGPHPGLDDVTTIVVAPAGGLPAKQAFTYSIVLPVGSLVDSRNNRPLVALSIEAGVSEFTVQDAEAPAVVRVEPAPLSSGVALDREFVLVFDEPVTSAAAPVITFAPVAAGGAGPAGDTPPTVSGEIVSIEASVVCGAAASAASGCTSAPGAVVSFRPSAALATAQGGQQYVATVAAGSLLDGAGLAMATPAQTNFTTVDLVGPAVVGTFPPKHAVVAVGTVVSVAFDEAVAAGTWGVATLTSASGAQGSPWQISVRAGSPLAAVAGDAVDVQIESLLRSSSGSVLLPFDTYTLSFAPGAVVDTAATFDGDAVANAYLGGLHDVVAWFGMADPVHAGTMFPQVTAANAETVFTAEFVSRVTVDPKSTVVITLPPLPEGAGAMHHGFLLTEADVRSSLATAVSPETSGLWVIQNVDPDHAAVTMKFNSQRPLPPGTKVIFTFAGVQTPNILGGLGASTIEFKDEGFATVDVLLDVSPLLRITNDYAPTFVGAPFAVAVEENDLAIRAGTADPTSPQPLVTLRAVDPDAVPGAALTFSIVTGAAGTTISPALAAFLQGDGVLSIDRSTGVLSVSGTIDFEALPQPRISVEVEVSETAAPFRSTTTTVDITVLDVNDNAPVFAAGADDSVVAASLEDAVVEGPDLLAGGYWFAIHENKTVGSSIGAVFAADADSGDNGVVSYSWAVAAGGAAEEASAALLALNPTSGAITVAASLVGAGASVLKYDVTATDGGTKPTRTAGASVSIHVLDTTQITSIVLRPVADGDRTAAALDYGGIATALQAVLCPDASCAVNILALSTLASGEVEVVYYAVSLAKPAGGAGGEGAQIIPTATVESRLASPEAMQLLNSSGAGLFFIPTQYNASSADLPTAAADSLWDRVEVVAGVAAAGAVALIFVIVAIVLVAKRSEEESMVVHIESWGENHLGEGSPVSPYMDPAEARPIRYSQRGSSQRGDEPTAHPGSMMISPLSQTSASYIDTMTPTSAARTMYEDDNQYFADATANAPASPASRQQSGSAISPAAGADDFDRIPTLLDRWSSDHNDPTERGTEAGWGTHEHQQQQQQERRPSRRGDGIPPPRRSSYSGRPSGAPAVPSPGAGQRSASVHGGNGRNTLDNWRSKATGENSARYYTPTSISDEAPQRRTQSSYYPSDNHSNTGSTTGPLSPRSQSDRRWNNNTNM